MWVSSGEFAGEDAAGAPADEADLAPVVACTNLGQPRGQLLGHVCPDAEVVTQPPVVGAVSEPAQRLAQELSRRRACEETRQHQNRMPIAPRPTRHLADRTAGCAVLGYGAPLSGQQPITRGRCALGVG